MPRSDWPRDTWALNEHVLDEAAFLEQCYDIHAERETMFFDALRKTSDGLVACVFDITDRVQHTLLAVHARGPCRRLDAPTRAIRRMPSKSVIAAWTPCWDACAAS